MYFSCGKFSRAYRYEDSEVPVNSNPKPNPAKRLQPLLPSAPGSVTSSGEDKAAHSLRLDATLRSAVPKNEVPMVGPCAGPWAEPDDSLLPSQELRMLHHTPSTGLLTKGPDFHTVTNTVDSSVCSVHFQQMPVECSTVLQIRMEVKCYNFS